MPIPPLTLSISGSGIRGQGHGIAGSGFAPNDRVSFKIPATGGAGGITDRNGNLSFAIVLPNYGAADYGPGSTVPIIATPFTPVTGTIPNAPGITQAGTPGAFTYVYLVVAVDGSGNHSIGGALGTTTTGPSQLTGINYNIITPPAFSGAVSFDVYRVVGGPSQGKIGNTPAGVPLNDQVLGGDGSSPPTVITQITLSLLVTG